MAEMVKTQTAPTQLDSNQLDKTVQSTTVQQSIKLPAIFSGVKPEKGECTYDLWKYEVDCLVKGNVYHSDLRDYISDTTRSFRRMHAWRLTRFISR